MCSGSLGKSHLCPHPAQVPGRFQLATSLPLLRTPEPFCFPLFAHCPKDLIFACELLKNRTKNNIFGVPAFCWSARDLAFCPRALHPSMPSRPRAEPALPLRLGPLCPEPLPWVPAKDARPGDLSLLSLATYRHRPPAPLLWRTGGSQGLRGPGAVRMGLVSRTLAREGHRPGLSEPSAQVAHLRGSLCGLIGLKRS